MNARDFTTLFRVALRRQRFAFAALSAASRSWVSAPERLEGSGTGLSLGVVGS